MAEDVPVARPAQKIRRMPKGYGRRREAGKASRGGKGRVEGGDMAPTQQTQGGASTSQGVEAVHLDLNEPVSGPSHVLMALGGTPPSTAHVPDGSWEVSFMEPARLPTPPASPAPTEQPDEPATRGRARRAPRRRGCGTGGHT
ncbi:hypothetical protein PIB30_010304 [Stylosanthes scabra]|uniref:Uncharacterized protein n=1 Tax=Stylosanthes scabra TaxID=79078 RepID=A0ABU6U4B0_9FABA|nr:hypothetical protein [Stylosanthes scabra]